MPDDCRERLQVPEGREMPGEIPGGALLPTDGNQCAVGNPAGASRDGRTRQRLADRQGIHARLSLQSGYGDGGRHDSVEYPRPLQAAADLSEIVADGIQGRKQSLPEENRGKEGEGAQISSRVVRTDGCRIALPAGCACKDAGEKRKGFLCGGAALSLPRRCVCRDG